MALWSYLRRNMHVSVAIAVILWTLVFRRYMFTNVTLPAEPDRPVELGVEQGPNIATEDEPNNEERVSMIPSSGEVSGKRIVQQPGVPQDAMRWKTDYSFIKTGMDLPRIYPRLNDELNRSQASKPTVVCVFNRAPRQRSLWTTNVLSMFGSGKFQYKSMEATDCQFFGTCKTRKESNLHPECSSETSPTVGLVEWVKCCFHDRFTKAINNQQWDVAVATGDEYCSSSPSAGGRDDFRFYYFDGSVPTDLSHSRYLPLGPREEFRRVKPKHLILASERMYLFNFVGSITSKSRRILDKVLTKGVEPPGTPSFRHVISAWSKEASRSNGYILPYVYRNVLLNSTFTLCPDGHNPEAYRIYEALEAGSIPIVALDEYYLDHSCKHAFAPFIQTGAPFVYLNSWTGLKVFLNKVYREPRLLIQMQADCMAWYSNFMQTKAQEFESVMVRNFHKRVQRTDNGVDQSTVT